MKIESVRIQNFRAFKDQTVFFNNYTCLVGPNGGGKSTVLMALNVFFRYSMDIMTNLVLLDEQDFHARDISTPIVITVTFTGLSPEAQNDFAGYFRQGKLIVSAKGEWSAATRSADVKQYGERLAIRDFGPFFLAEGDGAKVDELKKLYTVIRLKCQTLPAPGTKQAMIDALRTYEDNHPNECELIPSEDQFYGISRGKNLLEKYIQWIFVPAVKDATGEQVEARKTALGLILERTVRSRVSFAQALSEIREKAIVEYEKVLAERESALTALSESLRAKIRDWAHPDATVRLRWHADLNAAVRVADPLAEVLTGEGSFEGSLARFGHGLQRSFLLALLQELAGGDSSNSSTLVLACEEPELYQHPPQVRHLASVFQKLASSDSQIVVCTHSPLFVRGNGFEDIRAIRRDPSTSDARVYSVKFDQVADKIAVATGEKPIAAAGSAMKIAQALQPSINEMFFTSLLVLVEGLEDAAYINSYMVLTERWDDFRRLGCHVVAANGKHGMIHPLAIAKLLDIPTFLVFDADADKIARPDRKKQHSDDNRALLQLCGQSGANEFPAAPFWSESLVMWNEDIGSALAADVGADNWNDLHNRVKTNQKVVEVADLHKNMAFIESLLSDAWDAGMRFPSLDRLCASILDFARAQRVPRKEAGD